MFPIEVKPDYQCHVVNEQVMAYATGLEVERACLLFYGVTEGRAARFGREQWRARWVETAIAAMKLDEKGGG